MTSPTTETFRETIADMLHKNQKIQAVKLAKDFYGIGLKEGKDIIDSIQLRDWRGNVLPRDVVNTSVDVVCDSYERRGHPQGGAAAQSTPIYKVKEEKRASDVTILADALAEQVWARLEEKLTDVIQEVVTWDIKQLRNEINVVAQNVQDLAHGQ